MGSSISIPDFKTSLGGGSFGVVYKGTYGGKEVAVKVINKHMLINKGKYSKIDKNECIPFVKGLKHPNIVSILAWADKGHELWLALELCDTSLDRYLKDNNPNNLLTCHIICQGATGLTYLHMKNVIHRDLRPDNVLVLMKDTFPIIKITDFSLCKDIADQATSSMITVWGNPYWLAPELLTEDGHSATDVRYKRSIDVFSYGLVMLYVCVDAAGREMINKVNCGLKIKRGEDVLSRFENHWRSPGLNERFLPLLQSILAIDVNARPTMKDILCDKVFPPPEVPTPPCLCPLAMHILGYDAHGFVGVGADNKILVGRKDKEILYLLHVKDRAYSQVWEKACPLGVEARDRKYIVDRTITTRNYMGSGVTRCFDLEMTSLHEHQAGEGLDLVGCLAPHVQVYRERIGPSYQLVLHNGAVERLIPSVDPPWNKWLSMCQHAGTGWYAVCEHLTRSLDLFDEAGRHQHHIHLPYKPGRRDAIVNMETHFIVREYYTAVLHVYTWCGEEIEVVNVGKILKLDTGECVKSVGACESGRKLHLVISRGALFPYTVCSLHTLQVESPAET